MNEFNITGDRYFDGDGVEQNYETAFSYYQKAAEMNDGEGYFNMGFCYDRGLGVPQSDTQAIINYTKAGELGIAKAWRNLGFLLFFSVADDNDPKLKESFGYMLKAADMGDASAQAHVAQAYQGGAGWGAPGQDLAKAKEYLLKAVEQGNEHAKWVLAENYSRGEFGFEEDPALALKYYREAAEGGSNKAMYDYAVITYFGLNGATADHAAALEWAQKAYDEGNGTSAAFLGALKMLGLNAATAEADYAVGRQLISDAADEGLNGAITMMRYIPRVEGMLGKMPPELTEGLIFLTFMIGDHAEFERTDKEILVELQAPRAIAEALEGNVEACRYLSNAFLMDSDVNKQLNGYERIDDFDLMIKWAEKAYEIDPVGAADMYLAALALDAHIDNKIGAYAFAEELYSKAIEVAAEMRKNPDYNGYGRDPDYVGMYHTECAIAQIETGALGDAYHNLTEAQKYKPSSDVLYGLFRVFSTQDFYQADMGRAIGYLQDAIAANNWGDNERRIQAIYLLGIVYSDPAFSAFVKTDANRGYQLIKQAADEGHEGAKNELSHFKQGMLGGYKYVQ